MAVLIIKQAALPQGQGVPLKTKVVGSKAVPLRPHKPGGVPSLTSRVAAGAYNASGQLLRTLYAGTSKTTSQVLGLLSFDGKGDRGQTVSGATQLRKQLPNKLAARFAGIVANTSPQAMTNKIPFATDDQGNNVTGSNVWFGYRPFNCLSIGRTATRAYIGQGYTEGPQSHGAFALNDIQTRVNYQKIPAADRLTQGTCYQDQDATLLYHLGYDGIDGIDSGLSGTLPAYYRDYKSKWFIYATSLATGERVTFASGTNYAVMQGVRPQINYNGYQFSGRCAGMAVQKTGNLLFVSLPDTNEIIVLNKTTMAYVRTITSFTRPGALWVDYEERLWVASQNPGTPNTTPVKLSGQPVGAAGYGDGFEFSIDKAFDGNPSTYYASSANAPNGWLGLYVGPGVVITGVELRPSDGREADCMGWIQLSNANNNDDARDRRTVYQIATKPAAGQFTRYNFTNTRPWSYVRVFNPGKPLKLADMVVWGYRLTDTHVVASYTISSTGTLTATGVSLSGHQEVTALTDDANGNLYTREGGSKQAVCCYSKATGGAATKTWTSTEGVKFYFTDVYGTLLHNQESPAPLACAPDGSVWVGDTGNERLVHLSATGSFIEAIYYASHSRACLVDGNDPTRLFGENREYTLDPTKPLAPNNGSWRLAFNWSQTYNTTIYRYLKEVNTLANGRTYGVVAHEEFAGQPMRYVVELVKGVGVRFTPTVLPQGTRLEADGSLLRVAYTLGQAVRSYRRALTGFDANGNPQWAAEVALPAGPVPQSSDPRATTIRRFASGLHVVHDGSRVQAGGSPDYHVGGWQEGQNYFLFKTALATPTDYTGGYPLDGSFDTGNNVQDPGGPMTLLVDKTTKPLRLFVWCYMGENWKGKQCCYFHLIDADTGLLLLTFGSDAFENPPSMTSVVIGMGLIRVSNDVARLYVQEEGGRGFPVWEITGLSTLAYSVTPL
jgi:hypothetical protein